MSTVFHRAITSIEAVENTINSDRQVFRWFTFLIVQPAVKAKMLKEETTRQLYSNFKRTMALQLIWYVGLLGCLLVLVFSKHFIFLWLGILFLFPATYLHLNKKKYVRQISTRLLTQDFDIAELNKKTLYQIGESYSQKYNIPSLVDTIYFIDKISRATLITVFVLACLLLPFFIDSYQLNVWKFYFSLMIAYYLINALVNTNAIYRHLR